MSWCGDTSLSDTTAPGGVALAGILVQIRAWLTPSYFRFMAPFRYTLQVSVLRLAS